jgi:HK97 family phage major capsid protein
MDKEILNELKKAIEDFKGENSNELKAMKEQFARMELMVNQAAAGPPLSIKENLHNNKINQVDNHESFSVKVDGRIIPVLPKNESLAKYFPQNNNAAFSLADFVRGAMGIKAVGATSVVSSPALVPEYVGSMIIDMIRAASQVVQSGAGTIPIVGPTNLARVTGDATVYQHTMGSEDISDSIPTIEPVSLDPKSLVAAIPLSVEVVADSPNLDSVLNLLLAKAFAAKLDNLCLATILADSSIGASATGQDPANWAGVISAVSTMLTANQGLPTAIIGNSADFITRAGQIAISAGTWLGKPPFLSAMVELPTTKVTAGTAILGNFFKGFAIAVRQEMTVEVVRWHQYKSASHVLVAHSRMDGVVLQPGHLFIQKKTVA